MKNRKMQKVEKAQKLNNKKHKKNFFNLWVLNILLKFWHGSLIKKIEKYKKLKYQIIT